MEIKMADEITVSYLCIVPLAVFRSHQGSGHAFS